MSEMEKKMMVLSVLVVAFLFVALGAWAIYLTFHKEGEQRAGEVRYCQYPLSLSGVVMSDSTNQPIKGVRVAVSGSSAVVYTDSSGYFSIRDSTIHFRPLVVMESDFTTLLTIGAEFLPDTLWIRWP
jgi:hypothetical protein